MVAEQAPAGFQRGEVAGDDDDAAPILAGRGQVREPLDLDVAAQRRDRSPPRARELEHADAQRAEVLAQQARPRRCVQLGKTQRDVARGDVAATAQHQQQDRPQGAAERAL